MSKLNSYLSSICNVECSDPALPQEIQKAERCLNLSFSEEYRDYLLTYGYTAINGHEFTGLACAPYLNVVNVTLDERKYNSTIPNSWYVIEEAHIDGIIIWQDQDGNVYQSMPNSKAVKIAASMLEYLSDTQT